MAIKGKKKPASRGGQARRRPVSAPRPVAPVRKQPWYRTTQGLIVAGAIAIAVVVAALWAMANARTNAAELEDRQAALRSYTERVQGLLQVVNGPASQMATAGGLSDRELTKLTKSWREEFTSAQAQLSQLAPEAGTESANRLVQNSFFLYGSAAEAFALVPDADDALKDRLKAQGATQAAAAGGVLNEAITLLDDARRDADMSPSGLSAPGGAPPS